MICPKSYIVGFEQEKKFASSILKSESSTPAEAQIFVSLDQSPLSGWSGAVYAQSDFIPGSGDYPIKISTSDTKDLKLITGNIFTVGGHLPLPGNFESSYANRTTFFLDKSVFDLDGGLRIDLNGAKRLFLVARPSGETFPLTSRNLDGNDVWLAETPGRVCFRVAALRQTAGIEKYLRSQDFERKSALLVNLTSDSAVAKALTSVNLEVHTVGFDIPNKKAFEDLILGSKGKTVFLLSHIIGTKVVAETSRGGKPLFEIEVREVRDLSKRAGCTIIHFGCGSSRAGASIGIAEKDLNPLRVIEAIKLAVPDSKNHRDLLEKIAAPNQTIIIEDKDAIERPRYELFAAVESKDATAQKFERVCTVEVMGTQTA
jgi:hypothetical protein